MLVSGFAGGSVVKNASAKAGASGDSGSVPGRDDPLEKEMAPTPVSWRGAPRDPRSLAGCKASEPTERLSTSGPLQHHEVRISAAGKRGEHKRNAGEGVR